MQRQKEFTEYEIFHIHRIISTLLESEFPANTHGLDGKSDNGTYLILDRRDKVERIIRSLFELGLISHDEMEQMFKTIGVKEG